MYNINKNNFTVLRLIAAIQVLLAHSCDYISISHDTVVYNLSLFLSKYFHGVTIFFLISGFLVAYSYDKNDIFNYVKNRFLRIYPALYINIFIGVVLLYCFGYLHIDISLFKWVATQISFMQFYNLADSENFGTGEINAPLWTISIELIFYAILPVILYLYRKLYISIFVLFVTSIVAFIYNTGSDHSIFFNKLLNVSILPYLFIFLVGVYTYLKFELVSYFIKGKFIMWCICFLFFKEMEIIINNIFFSIFVNYIVFAGFIFSFAFSFVKCGEVLGRNDYTYGIYIYHMLFVNSFVELGLLYSQKYVLLVFVCSILSGMISWFCIEKPCLKLKTKSIYK